MLVLFGNYEVNIYFELFFDICEQVGTFSLKRKSRVLTVYPVENRVTISLRKRMFHSYDFYTTR